VFWGAGISLYLFDRAGTMTLPLRANEGIIYSPKTIIMQKKICFSQKKFMLLSCIICGINGLGGRKAYCLNEVNEGAKGCGAKY
jgi:hypothetical protein